MPNKSYFQTCPRDETGHCLPQDEANRSGQGGDKPQSEMGHPTLKPSKLRRADKLAAGKEVTFSDTVVSEPEFGERGPVSGSDYGRLEDLLTPEESSEMEEDLERTRAEVIDELMDSYEPEVDERDVLNDLDFSNSDIEDKFKDLLLENSDEDSDAVMPLLKELQKVSGDLSRQGYAGPEFANTLLDRLESKARELGKDDEHADLTQRLRDASGDDEYKAIVNSDEFLALPPNEQIKIQRSVDATPSGELPADFNSAVASYISDMESDIESAIQERKDSDAEQHKEDLENDYDSSDDKKQWLRDFYERNKDDDLRFSGLSKGGDCEDMTWCKDGDGDGVLNFTTSGGQNYKVAAVEFGSFQGKPVYDMQFSNEDKGGTFKITGTGNAFEVFSTVTPAITAYIQKNDLPLALFSAAEPSRQKLYDKLTKTVAAKLPDYAAGYVDIPMGKGNVTRQYVVVKRDQLEAAKEHIKKKTGQEMTALVKSLWQSGQYKGVAQLLAARPLGMQTKSMPLPPQVKGCPLFMPDEARMGYDQPSSTPTGGVPKRADEAPADYLRGRRVAKLAATSLLKRRHKSIGQFLFTDAVREFRAAIGNLQRYGVQVPYLNDSQIARIIEQVAGRVMGRRKAMSWLNEGSGGALVKPPQFGDKKKGRGRLMTFADLNRGKSMGSPCKPGETSAATGCVTKHGESHQKPKKVNDWGHHPESVRAHAYSGLSKDKPRTAQEIQQAAGLAFPPVKILEDAVAAGHVVKEGDRYWLKENAEIPNAEPAPVAAVAPPEVVAEPEPEPEPVSAPAPAADSGPDPVAGGNVGGGTGGTAAQIVTARADLVTPGDPNLVPEHVRQHLKEHQVQGVAKALDALEKHGGFLLADGVGTGKTREQLGVAQTMAGKGKKVLIVSPAQVLKQDWQKGTISGSWADDSKAMGVGLQLNRGDKPLLPGQVNITTYQNLAKFKNAVDDNTVIVYDECFPAGTPVLTDGGWIPIDRIVEEKLQVRVACRNLETGEFAFRMPTRYFKNQRRTALVAVRHSHGTLTCTENHHVWTRNRGYVEAASLRRYDQLCMVQEAVRSDVLGGASGAAVLREVVFGEVAHDTTCRKGAMLQPRSPRQIIGVEQSMEANSNRGAAAPSFCITHEAEQPHGIRQDRCEDDAHQGSEWDAARLEGGTGWQWQADGAGTAVAESVGARVEIAAASVTHSTPRWVSDELQAGCGQQGTEGRGGNRRTRAPAEAAASVGPEEATEAGIAWVDGVTFLEQRNRQRPDGSFEEDSFVYCLEVDEHHNFFADGVLVSNCHALKNYDSATAENAKNLNFKAHSVMFATATPVDKVMHLGYLFRAKVFGEGTMGQTLEKLGMSKEDQHVGGGKIVQVWKANPGISASERLRRLEGLFDQMTKDGLTLKREVSLHGVDIATDHVDLPPEAQEAMKQIEKEMSGEEAYAKIQHHKEAIWDLKGSLYQLASEAKYHSGGFGGSFGIGPIPESIKQAMAKVKEKIAKHQEGLQAAYAEAKTKNRGAVLMAMRMAQERFKVDHAVESIQKELAEGRKVVLFGASVNPSVADDESDTPTADAVMNESTMQLLREKLTAAGIKFGELHGGVTKGKQLKAMNEFQNGDLPVMIGTVQSGGVGINLDDRVGDKPRTLLMMTPPFSAVDNIQAAGRINRLTTKSASRIRFLLANTPIDKWNANLISSKMGTLGAAVKGAVGDLDVELEEGPEDPVAGAEKLIAEHGPFQWGSLLGNSNPSEWTMPFGKHAGKPLKEVPADYLQWAKDKMTALNPAQKKKIAAHLGAQPAPAAKPAAPAGQPGDYVMPFGKHQGKPLKNMPESYLMWMADQMKQGQFASKPELKQAVLGYLSGNH